MPIWIIFTRRLTHYSQDSYIDAQKTLKNGASKIIVDLGKVVKISKSKSGEMKREPLTKKWSDWIDYWSVDFDFESRQETILQKNPDSGEFEEIWTGNYVFENEWQSFRTNQDRTLELKSAIHEYPHKGDYKIAVKVVDIFGNDTTKILKITI